MDYLKLAEDLFNAKRRMVNISDFRKFVNPNDGESFVLEYLNEKGHMVSPKQISEAMGVSSARIATILNQLAEKKMIRRKPNPRDNRYIVVELLAAGNQQRQENKHKFNQCAARFLEALGEEDAADYVRLQNKIADIYTKYATTGKKDPR